MLTFDITVNIKTKVLTFKVIFILQMEIWTKDVPTKKSIKQPGRSGVILMVVIKVMLINAMKTP